MSLNTENTEKSGEKQSLVEKIRKLFALAGSPNKHEAQRALSKAQELMLKHGIEELGMDQQAEAVEKMIYFATASVPDVAKTMYSVLAKEYRCVAYYTKHYVLLVGAGQTDVELCEDAITYAMQACIRCWKAYWKGLDRKGCRNRAKGRSAYIHGFTYGIQHANYRHREAEQLPAVIVPQLISDYVDSKYKVKATVHPTITGEMTESFIHYARKGYSDGKIPLNKQISQATRR